MGAIEQGADATTGRWLTIPRTLCFIRHENDVLLMKRDPHRRIFPNQYNGIGGHVERGEDPFQSALREIQEETGLTVDNLLLRGIHNIDTGHETGILMFVFSATAQQREFHDSGIEGRLHWIPLEEIAKLDLVEDLPYIVPRIFHPEIDERLYYAHVSYDETDTIQIRFSPEMP